VGRTNYLLKTSQFKRICPTLACTTPKRYSEARGPRTYSHLCDSRSHVTSVPSVYLMLFKCTRFTVCVWCRCLVQPLPDPSICFRTDVFSNEVHSLRLKSYARRLRASHTRVTQDLNLLRACMVHLVCPLSLGPTGPPHPRGGVTAPTARDTSLRAAASRPQALSRLRSAAARGSAGEPSPTSPPATRSSACARAAKARG
jgi:hypothetical protein